MKILIVDDVPGNLRLLRAMLEGENLVVIVASNGVEGLAVLESQRVDAIISDILMPGMDGYRFCEEVRRNERFHHLPFIIYTATYTSPADEKLALDMGADRYMKKPAPIKEIIEALHAILRRKLRLRPQRLPPEEELNRSKMHNDTLVNKLEQKNRKLSEQTVELEAREEKFRHLSENREVLWKEVERPVTTVMSPDQLPPQEDPDPFQSAAAALAMNKPPQENDPIL
jgi:DNA-binding response OmpR family regulator